MRFFEFVAFVADQRIAVLETELLSVVVASA